MIVLEYVQSKKGKKWKTFNQIDFPLNAIKTNINGFEQNNTIDDLITSIDSIDANTYTWIDNPIPSLGGLTIRGLSKKNN